jgi:two-component system cell cycle sensor histidine kinase/response regulator CckA
MFLDPPIKSLTVLVVEDESFLLEYVRLVLSRYGFNVLTAQTGEEGWAVFRKNRDSIRLVLTDIVMPGSFDGFELSERIAQVSRDILTIFMTGALAEDDPRAEELTRQNRLLRKPFYPDQLLEIVRDNANISASSAS